MKLYGVTLHEKQYYGSINESRVAQVLVRASSVSKAEKKALEWWHSQEQVTACRVSQVYEDREYQAILP
jgi:hypothetical protein